MAAYNEEALRRLTGLMDELMASEGGFESWRKLSGLLERASAEVLGEAVELEELFDAWKREATLRCMRIDRVHFSDDCLYTDEAGKDGYELLFENEDGSFSWSRRVACKSIDGTDYVPASILETLLKMAWQGFRLTEKKAWERKLIKRGENYESEKV